MRIFWQLSILIAASLQWSISNADSISGNQYLELKTKEKGWYFLGVLDAMKQTRDTYFAASDYEKVDFDRIWESCISGRPVRQHIAIVDAWLQKHPNRWHETAIKLIFDAERDSCDELEQTTDDKK